MNTNSYKNSNVFRLILAIVFFAALAFSTYAWLSSRLDHTRLVLTLGSKDKLVVTLTPYKINGSLDLVSNYDDGIEINVTASNNSNDAETFYLYYVINDISQELITSDFRYKVTKSTDNGASYGEVDSGTFESIEDMSRFSIYEDEVLGGETYKYKVYLWLQELDKDQSSLVGTTFNGNLMASFGDDELLPLAPVLDEGMIPVTISNNGTATVVSPDDSNWYNYDYKRWANVVLVKETASGSANSHDRSYYKNASDNGTANVTVDPSDILAYYVWIPRYSYRVWTLSSVTSGTTKTSEESSIDIKFINSETVETGSSIGEYRTHPAFTFGGSALDGIWVAKFEYSNTSGSTANMNCSDETCANSSNLRVLPNQFSLRSNSVASFFYASRSMQKSNNVFGLSTGSNTDSHMIKNSEWGAVAYLSHSTYGINDEITINNNSYFKTGCGANSAGSSTSCQISFGGAAAYPQSTTGNITGVFDISGGAGEYTMGVYNSTAGSSGFSTLPDSKYYDSFPSSNCTFSSCGGQATSETLAWHEDKAAFIDSSNPWFIRGGTYQDTSKTGAFFYEAKNGGLSPWRSSRGTIVVLNSTSSSSVIPTNTTPLEMASSVLSTSEEESNYFLSTEVEIDYIESIAFSSSLEGHSSNDENCWDVGETKDGTVLAWATDSDNDGLYEITIGSNGRVKANSDSSKLFWYCPNLTSITGTNNFDTFNVTDMSYMFSYNGLTSLNVSSWDTSSATTMLAMFYGCSNLTSLNVSNWNTSNVIDMSWMFSNMTNLVSLDLGGWNVSSATDMSGMFYSMYNLTSLNVSNWDTSNVTNMADMFNFLENLTNLDVSSWNTSSAANMGGMFYSMENLTSLNLSNWNTSRVNDMHSMFSDMTSLTTIYVGNGWDTANVNYSEYMFYGDGSLVGGMGTAYTSSHIDKAYAHIDGGSANPGYLTSISGSSSSSSSSSSSQSSTSTYLETANYNYYFLSSDIDKSDIESITFSNSLEGHSVDDENCWDVGETKDGTVLAWTTDSDNDGLYEVTIGSNGGVKANPNSQDLFAWLTSIESINGLANFDTSNVTNMAWMFYDVQKLPSLNLSSWDTSKVTNMDGLFANMNYLTNLDVSNWNTSNVRNMSSMFHNVTNLTSLDVSNWNTSNVTDMNNLFYCMNNLINLNVSNWNTSNVTDMSFMFSEVSSLTSLNVSNWDTSKVIHMYYTFADMDNLTSLNVSNWNTSSATSMIATFYGLSNLTSLDVSNWDTSNVIHMSSMFHNVTNLTSLDVSNWNTSSATDMSGMFYNMSNLTSLDVSNFNTSSVTTMRTMFYGLSNLTSLNLSTWNTSSVTTMNYMFSNMYNLTTVYVGNGWRTTNVIGSVNMFLNVTNVVGGMGTTYNASYIDKTYAHIDGGSTDPGYFTAAPSANLNLVGPNPLSAAIITKSSISVRKSSISLDECNSNCGTSCLLSGDTYICPSYSCSGGIVSGTNCYKYR